MEKIVLFDGECNFCNKSVQFIIKRDPEFLFKFASLQSDFGMQLLKKYDLPTQLDSIVFIDNNRAYLQSSAALGICKYLRGFWKIFSILLFIPSPLRNFFYKIIAKFRYRLAGRVSHCNLPRQEDKKRFLP
ncbi:MAG TPA: DCC1-like thiol-disulfide oxidoreductase family protein [Pseudogracilibacillus sp.]|nr:DCC1-like thiol-disulfide oxidoreductase family protein [Pseudogracilibacillus sp.]